MMAADPGSDTPPPLPCTRERVLATMALFPLAFIVAAFALDRPGALWDGLLAILRSRDTLTTDYMGLGGIGAALILEVETSNNPELGEGKVLKLEVFFDLASNKIDEVRSDPA